MLVVFDIDGTLTRTCDLDAALYARAFVDTFGFPLPRLDWSAYHHATDRGIAEEALRRAGRDVSTADLATMRPDIVVFSCTSAGALRGRDYEARLCGEIAETTGAPVVSTMEACRDALVRLGVRSVTVVTPYPESLTGPIRTGLEADGLAVPVARGLGLTDSLDIAAVAPDAIVRFAVETFRRGPADAVFVACCTFREFDARDAIAAALGVPVVTSNQAALDAALRALDGDTIRPDQAPR